MAQPAFTAPTVMAETTKKSLPRLFVALELPEMTTAQLQPLVQRDRLKFAKWVPSKNWHITLHFIGAASIESVKSALGKVNGSPFDVQLRSMGTFGAPQKPRILWAGVKKSDKLLEFQKRVGEALREAGFKLDDRPYSPHVTLAKFGSLKPPKSAAVKDFVAGHKKFESTEFCADSFTLYESVSSKEEGLMYVPRQKYSLVTDITEETIASAAAEVGNIRLDA